MKIDVAFLCPIHKPCFNFGYNLLSSFYNKKLNKQADFYFVFSNQEEADAFEFDTKKIVMPQTFNLKDNKGIITIKKFYGLSQIKDKYKYVIVLDDESLFYQKLNILNICENYFDNKILYGNNILETEYTDNFKNLIIKETENNFVNYHFSKLDQCLWFNQLCIYKTDNIDDFFEKINYKERFDTFKWYEFDYYLYMYYLIIFHNFKVVSLNSNAIWSFCDNSFDITDEDIGEDYKKYKFNLLSIYMLYKIGKNINKENLLLIIHTDRLIHLTKDKKDCEKLLIKLYKENKIKIDKNRSNFIKKMLKFIAIFMPIKKIRKKIRNL